MTIEIDINADNEAFEENGGPELARILRLLAGAAEDWDGEPGILKAIFDANGNRVGTMRAVK